MSYTGSMKDEGCRRFIFVARQARSRRGRNAVNKVRMNAIEVHGVTALWRRGGRWRIADLRPATEAEAEQRNKEVASDG